MTRPLTPAEHLEQALAHLAELGVPAGACELRAAFNDHGTVRRVTVGHWTWARVHRFGRRQLDVPASLAKV